MYRNVIKRVIDILLSGIGIIILAVPMLIVALVIFIDEPGLPIFVQKRVGKNKKLFGLLKFKSMKKDAPHDVPTHLLENPDEYMLRCGKFIRKFSIDELPQMLNIFVGHMSIVGPRPALWNQDDLVAEREKYGANSVRPGLTGWAQINGRDELEIPEKARLDGEYVKKESFIFDCRCFFGTFIKVLRHDGYVDGKKKESSDKQ